MGACHSEEQKIDHVLKQYPAVAAVDAKVGQIQKVTGHVFPASDDVFHAPVSGKPCVWYRTIIEEQRIHTATTQKGISHFYAWHQIVVAEQVSDFYIADGDVKVLIAGQGSGAKYQSVCFGGKNGVWSGEPPPGVALMVDTAVAKATGKHDSNWWERKSKNKTGKYRYSEQAFDVNEIVCALGVVTDIGGELTIEACTEATEVDMAGWNGHAKSAWKELVKEGHVILSDHPDQVAGVEVRMLLAQLVVPRLPCACVFSTTTFAAAPDFNIENQ